MFCSTKINVVHGVYYGEADWIKIRQFNQSQVLNPSFNTAVVVLFIRFSQVNLWSLSSRSGHVSLSKPPKFLLPTEPGNSFKQWEHPKFAPRPLNPQHLHAAGISHATHISAIQESNLYFGDSAVYSLAPGFQKFINSSTSGCKNGLNVSDSYSNAGITPTSNCLKHSFLIILRYITP